MSTPAPILQYSLASASMMGLLPAGYTPLAYIEFTGTQHIDTGIKANQNTIATVEVVPTSGSGNILGSRTGPSSNNFYMFYNSSAAYIDFNAYDSSRLTAGITYGTKYLFYNSASRRQINSTSTTTTISGSFTTPTNLMLGAKGNDSGVGDEKLKGKVYRCTVSEGNTPKLDLRPAIQDSNGAIGMYDLVSRTFKTNAGSGTFIAGPSLAIGKGGGKSLPEEYQQVEYLESTGTQYINAGLATTATQKFKVKWSDWTNSESMAALFGSTSQWGNTFLRFNGVSFLTTTSPSYRASSVTGTCWGEIELYSNGTAPVGTINGSVSMTSYSNTDGVGNNLTIFRGGANNKYAVAKLMYLQVYDGSTLQRYFFPCYRKSDMKPGMYDTVNGVFYTNSGSGEFILGPTINTGYTQEPNAAETPNLCIAYAPFQEVTLNDYNSTGSFTQFQNAAFAISDYAATVGKTYTISFDAISPNGTSDLQLYNANGTPRYFYYSVGLGSVTTSWQHYSYTFTSSDRGSGNAVSHPVEIYAPSKMKVRIRNLRVSEGATDWNANKRQGLYTNLSTTYDSSKGWVAGFNGSNSRIYSSADLVSMFNTRTWSISFWFNTANLPTSEDPSVWKRLILYRKATTSDANTKQLVVYLTKTSIGTSFYGDDTAKTISGLAINTWYHVVITQNGGTATYYVNGNSLGTSSKNTLAIPAGSYLQIGYDADRGMGAFNGMLSNIQVWNSVLTAAQVQELYGK